VLDGGTAVRGLDPKTLGPGLLEGGIAGAAAQRGQQGVAGS
jgi:hypothetical protein